MPELVKIAIKVTNKTVRVFYQDEARFGKICQARKVGLPKGERSEVKAHTN